MESRLVVLKLVLDELGIPPGIGSVKQRKEKQKATYLAQVLGLDLGYRFGWHIMGPYCPSLARDYYSLNESLLTEGALAESLDDEVKNRLKKAKSVIDLPPPKDLKKADWLELLASWHYLQHVARLSDDEIKATLEKEKPHIAQHADKARAALA